MGKNCNGDADIIVGGIEILPEQTLSKSFTSNASGVCPASYSSKSCFISEAAYPSYAQSDVGEQKAAYALQDTGSEVGVL